MRRKLSLLISGAACAGLLALFGAAPAAADLGCPDDHFPVHESFVRQGERKDHNGNDRVCVKPTTCVSGQGVVCNGGPDDEELVGVPLRGDDGVWYYVIDDTEV